LVTRDAERLNFAHLIVKALEIGTSKREWDVIDDLFAAFRIDAAAVLAADEGELAKSTDSLENAAAEALANAAPSVEALLSELVRCGGRFVAMVEEVYAFLAGHVVTTAGSTEEFRFRRGDVDAELTISPAFIEQIHTLSRSVRPVPYGQIDDKKLSSFLLCDGGEFYGSWPLDADTDRLRLVDGLLLLGWLSNEVEALPDTDERRALLRARTDAARAAATRVVAAAEELVYGYVSRMAGIDPAKDETAPGELFVGDLSEWHRDAAVVEEIRRFRRERTIGAWAAGNLITGLSEDSFVGVRGPSDELSGAPEGSSVVVMPATIDTRSSSVGDLASFVAMWRSGRVAARSRAEFAEQLASEPDALAAWLEQLREAAVAASEWLSKEVLIPTGSVDATILTDSVQDYLNLPLWRQRSLLYEVWILCATLEAARRAHWAVSLEALAREGTTWTLQVGPTKSPVATLRLGGDDQTVAEVWREPARRTDAGKYTPDVAVSTPGPVPRDLLIVEAKDRFGLPAGAVDTPSGAAKVLSGKQTRSAYEFGMRYVTGLRPLATWVCNHCDFQEDDVEPTQDFGDAWSHLHLASEFRPGGVSETFYASVQQALLPPGRRPEGVEAFSQSGVPRAYFVVDATGSMREAVERFWVQLVASPSWSSRTGEFFAVVYSDHGPLEPFLVETLGPLGTVVALAQEVMQLPPGDGHDREEALEDAVRACRDLVDTHGLGEVVVVTDAPPHPATDCPFGYDFETELLWILASGATCFLVRSSP
jgi:hypothetical protein